ncbi:ABC transporter permease [Streptomyces sp. NPDC051546]|uniref:ABC transporter permease n=1 Tax=Streptomyces sp. NPDC051546 TaxID=3365655 RepID=UPI0037880E6D
MRWRVRWRVRRDGRIRPSVFGWRDVLSESLAGMLQRPGRSALTALGTVLGVGTFVAILGLTATTSSQIDTRFNALSATEVTVEDVANERDEFAGPAFPADADARIERLNGVERAGVFWPVRLSAAEAVRASVVAGDRGAPTSTDVVAASPGVLAAAGARLAEGRLYDAFAADREAPVAVIGTAVADRLGITTLETSPAIFIGGRPFTVIGIVADTDRKADLLMSVVVPRTTAERIWGGPGPGGARMLVATRLGAAQQIGRLAPTALRPDHPEYFKVVPPPDPKMLRGQVGDDLNRLFLLLASICLVIGAVGIANTTLVAVLERTGEIGLRRALGARGRHITVQFLAESGALGALGGLVGTSLGVLTVVLVAVVRDWTPVIHPATAAAAPVIGLVTGLVAGLYPAWRAARIQPAEALRR